MRGGGASEGLSVLPTFLVIGAGRAGTTSLHRWLAEHPDVFVSEMKETNYFAFEALQLAGDRTALPRGQKLFPIRSWQDYTELFRRAGARVARGEVSPTYLAWPSVPERIAARLPDVRLIAMLRHPVDRAYSSYLMHARDGRERRTFASAVRQELEGRADPTLSYGQLNYVRIGFYGRHLSAYMDRFDGARIHVELFDDLRSDLPALLRRVYRFLCVDDGFEPDTSIRMNPSGVPRRRILGPFLRKSPISRLVKASLPRALAQRAAPAWDRWRARRLVRPPLDRALRADLIDVYRRDILKLGPMVGRDLMGWLESDSLKRAGTM